MKTLSIHILAALGVAIIGGLIGYLNIPGEWYQSLQKPFFTPPNWAFGPIWTTLYLLIGWVGARKYLQGGEGKLWLLQMVLNFLWSPVFFGLQLPVAGLVIILALLASIMVFTLREWNSDRLSAVLFLPYLAWVTLASCLNLGIVFLN